MAFRSIDFNFKHERIHVSIWSLSLRHTSGVSMWTILAVRFTISYQCFPLFLLLGFLIPFYSLPLWVASFLVRHESFAWATLRHVTTDCLPDLDPIPSDPSVSLSLSVLWSVEGLSRYLTPLQYPMSCLDIRGMMCRWPSITHVPYHCRPCHCKKMIIFGSITEIWNDITEINNFLLKLKLKFSIFWIYFQLIRWHVSTKYAHMHGHCTDYDFFSFFWVHARVFKISQAMFLHVYHLPNLPITYLNIS